MLSNEGYLIGWLVYLGSACLVYGLLTWKLRRWRFASVQLFIRGLVAILLFTPVVTTLQTASGSTTLLAPAHLSAVLALSQQDFVMAEKALINVALITFLVFLMFLMKALVNRILGDGLPRKGA